MKIAVIVREYHKWGGISRCAAEIAEYFAADNEVHVFTASWQNAEGTGIIFHKVPMLSFGFLKKKKLKALNNIFEIASFALFSRLIVKPGNFDVVHSQGCYVGISDVFTTHSCHAESLAVSRQNRTGFLGKLKKTALNPLHLLLLTVEYYSLKNTKKIIAISQSVKNDIIKHYGIHGDKIEVVTNGVDANKFNPNARVLYRDEVRLRHGLKPEDKVLIFPAHEFERKGLSAIIYALNIIQNSDLYVLVAGVGDPSPFRPLIKKLGLDKNIIFTGRVTDIEKYYAASDILVFPTYYEPFGLVILEAMAAGLPVITTRLAGASHLISNYVSGIILDDQADYRAIAKTVCYLINDDSAARALGENARKVAERYPWGMIAEKVFNLYENVMLDRSYETDFGQCVASCLQNELSRHAQKYNKPILNIKHVRTPLEVSKK